VKIKKRLFDLNLPRGKSAFLWGPRKVGKTNWISHTLSGVEKKADHSHPFYHPRFSFYFYFSAPLIEALRFFSKASFPVTDCLELGDITNLMTANYLSSEKEKTFLYRGKMRLMVTSLFHIKDCGFRLKKSIRGKP
jgi:hypothetical protein